MKINPAFRLCLPLAAALVILAASLLCLPHNTRAALPTGDQAALFRTNSPGEAEPAPLPDPRWLALSKAAEPAPMAVSVVSAEAATTSSINIDLLNGHVAGRVPLPTLVTLRLVRNGEVLVTVGEMPVPEPGSYYYYFTPNRVWEVCDPYPPYCTIIRPLENDELWLEQSGAVFSMTVPHLTALASSEEDRVFGETLPGASLNIYFYPEDEPTQVYTATAVASTGGYSAILPVNVQRKDSGFSQVEVAPGRYAYRALRAPLLAPHVGGIAIYGSAAPGEMVMIDVINPDADELIAATENYVDSDGFFSAYVYLGSNQQVLTENLLLRAECAGQTFSMTIPHLTAFADIAAGKIGGETIPGAPLEILRFDGPIQGYIPAPWVGNPTAHTSLSAEPDGEYSASMPLSPPDYGVVAATLSDEHQAFTHFVTPYLLANVGTTSSSTSLYLSRTYVLGQLPVYNQPITLAVEGPSGYLKDQLQSFTLQTGNFTLESPNYSGLVIDSGDLMTVTAPGLAPVSVPVPLFTAEGDYETNQIWGKAPPGSSLRVSIYNGYSPIYPPEHDRFLDATLDVTATASGDYLADFTGTFTLTQYSSAAVTLWTAEGHALQRHAEFPNPCSHGVSGARIGSHRVEMTPRSNCSQTFLRLLTADGREKGTAVIPEYVWEPSYVSLYDQDYTPAIIEPGDWLEANYLGTFTRFEVPALNARIDEQASAISGTAPAGSEVTAILKSPDGSGFITGTAGLDGSYLLPISDPSLLTGGLFAKVMLSGSDPVFYVLDVLPLLETTLYYNRIWGTIMPYSSYTLTWQSPTGEFTATGTTYSTGYVSQYMDAPLRIVSPGDLIRLQTQEHTVSMTVPLLSAELDSSSATVTGVAPPESRLVIELYNSNQYYYWQPDASQIVTSTTNGDFSAAFPEMAPLTRAYGSVIYRDGNGHKTYYSFANPYLEITIGEMCMSGSVPAPRQPYALTHQSVTGATEVYTGTAYGDNGLFGECLQEATQPGDLFMLESPAGSMVFSYTVPELTALHDYELQAVIGAAPPQVALDVKFYPPNFGEIFRRTASGADGRFGVDTSDLPLSVRTSGNVAFYDPAGAIVRRNFVVSGYQHFFPVMMR